MNETALINAQEHLKGQITAVQNVLSMLIVAHPNSEQLKSVIQTISQQVAPTLDQAHPEFKKGWLAVIANVCQTEEGGAPGTGAQH
ncbi:hypothetical protein GCM10023144_45500 [Pigmentiphaga soli]|uniref:Uncharacterized protein n=1 Tax=Pigmentiphaga soli TaxID=1007095 RepID=A0ABP8HQZ1_9BURK